jgi:hypothetical protein
VRQRLHVTWLGWMAAALSLAGCGGSAVKVGTLSPSLQIEDQHKVNGDIKVAVGPFEATSDRLKKKIIGKAKTGLFNADADIIANEPVESMVAAAIKNGLERAGFAVVDRPDAGYVLHGRVETFCVDEYATGMSLEYSKAHVKIEVLMDDATGKTVWGSTLDRYETSGSNLWDATDSDIPTLTKAFQFAVESIFKDEAFWKAVGK